MKLYKPMTTDRDLYEIAKQQGIKIDAIVFKDQLKTLTLARNIILNLESSNHHGSHWTSLFISNDNRPFGFYTDSFGILPPVDVIEFCRDRGIDVLIYNKVQFQDIHSGYCGELSVSMIGLLQSIFD